MRVVQFAEYGPPEVLHQAEMECPVAGPGEIILRVGAAAVNPADTKWRQGMFRDVAPLTFPHVVGYDVAGTIAATGEGVELLPGRRGVAMLSMGSKGGYAEFARLPASDFVPIPETMDLAVAAALPTAGLTGYQLIEDHLRPSPGETVLITGATGAVGRFAVHAALALGARVVAAVRAGREDEARALGAVKVFELEPIDPSAEIPHFDHVCDTVGGAAVARICERLSGAGRIGTAATTPIPMQGLAGPPEMMVVRPDPSRLADLVQLVAQGDLSVPIACRLPLESAPFAHHLIERGGLSGKVVLEP
ncbi:NADP-dependent oxidoreductase [Novosphingobium pentaromativorans]|nr:NADP-dependent oxidoreductase [Novosphingobium pentaromativorans]AIT79813.1 hypothetical protein JI59_08490 [Novosphingobium pentaromativorans US6-1]